MEILHVYPDRTTRLLPGEPLRFVVSVRNPPEHAHLEIWTDIPCAESHHTGDYAIALRKSRSGEYSTFERTITPTRCGFFTFSVRYRDGQRWAWHGGGAYETRARTELAVDPAWTHSIVYNAFVRQFGAKDRDGDGIILPGEGGTFDDLINRMDHFTRLGVGAIYLNPIQITGDIYIYDEEIMPHYQDETNHLPVHMHPGSVYSLKDYKSIDPELGLNPRVSETDQYQEFRRFVEACHARGIRVILDIVFGHTARDSFIQRLHPEWFLYKRTPHTTQGAFLSVDDHDAWGKPEYACSPYDHGMFWTDCSRLNWDFLPPPGDTPAPKNPRLAQMREYCKSVLRYWITQYGVDGFRLDVAYSVPADFWREAIADCRAFAQRVCEEHALDPRAHPCAPISPDILMIGETYVDGVQELQECGITMLNGDFSSKIFTVEQLKGYLEYAYNISGDYFPRNSRWMLFPECHDFARLPQKAAGLCHTPDADVRLNRSRWTLAALLPGTPMLHNGFEVVEHKNVSVRSYTSIDWSSPKDITPYLARINAIRNAHPALQRGSYTFVDSEQGVSATTQLYSFLRDLTVDGTRETFLVVVNMDVNARADGVRIMLPALDGYDWSSPFMLHDLLTDARYERASPEVVILLDPGESHVFQILQPHA